MGMSARFRFGKEVRRLRNKTGWTQKELAKRAGLSRRYLQEIESKNPPDVTIDTLKKIADGFRRNISEILRQI